MQPEKSIWYGRRMYGEISLYRRRRARRSAGGLYSQHNGDLLLNAGDRGRAGTRTLRLRRRRLSRRSSAGLARKKRMGPARKAPQRAAEPRGARRNRCCLYRAGFLSQNADGRRIPQPLRGAFPASAPYHADGRSLLLQFLCPPIGDLTRQGQSAIMKPIHPAARGYITEAFS